MTSARRIRVRGVVQGVGFRPFVYRLAHTHGLTGWVLNAQEGVQIHIEGSRSGIDDFVTSLKAAPPPASRISRIEVAVAQVQRFESFEIRASTGGGSPTVRISPDLAVCEGCRRELFDPDDPRFRYPYINCTDCGPRYTIIQELPYDRPRTTMSEWPMCRLCASEYADPINRRFHAQPVACSRCGPTFLLTDGRNRIAKGAAAIDEAARRLAGGVIVAVKGLGGYHLACDASDAVAVAALRERKFRKEKPFAVMAADLEAARQLVELLPEAEELMTSVARPIVLAPARRELEGVAPDNRDLGVMLPYAPLHFLLFAAGAPRAIVMTSANRSSEPIAYRDEDARERLAGLADCFLIGERPIARRVDDSVVRVDGRGVVLLRRARGYAPAAAARLPLREPVLAVGADLKNTVTLVVDGEAFVSQHVGDLSHFEALEAFRETVRDLVSMYGLETEELTVMHDLHPEYASTGFAVAAPARACFAVQHHRAHIASVLVEREAFEEPVVGVAFDGTGYGDDSTIWGGEFFFGSIADGFARVAHLRSALLPGGDAAARHPVQAAAGFLAELGELADLSGPPFDFPPRYAQAVQLIEKEVRLFRTTSAGRLFDTVAAIAGFTRPASFEGQAAMWLEHQARTAPGTEPWPIPFEDGELDYRPALQRALEARRAGEDAAAIAAGFHAGLAAAIVTAVGELCETCDVQTAVLSGGVFQNQLLLAMVAEQLESRQIAVWTNSRVPPNDGGISLGQVAFAMLKAPEEQLAVG